MRQCRGHHQGPGHQLCPLARHHSRRLRRAAAHCAGRRVCQCQLPAGGEGRVCRRCSPSRRRPVSAHAGQRAERRHRAALQQPVCALERLSQVQQERVDQHAHGQESHRLQLCGAFRLLDQARETPAQLCSEARVGDGLWPHQCRHQAELCLLPLLARQQALRPLCLGRVPLRQHCDHLDGQLLQLLCHPV